MKNYKPGKFSELRIVIIGGNNIAGVVNLKMKLSSEQEAVTLVETEHFGKLGFQGQYLTML